MPNRPRTPLAFTLLELLVVLAVTALLGLIAFPALQGLLNRSNLNGGANSVAALLDLARQEASARNLAVEVRIYQDTSAARDRNGNFPYRMLALVIPATVSGAAHDEFLTRVLILPGNVIVDSSPTYSTVLNTSLGIAGWRPTGATELPSAPQAAQGLPYIRFTYLPDGTIHLDSSQKWCLTLVNGNQAQPASGGGPAANFVTIILDVPTSREHVYRP
jgi:uncharacterized protein (TIGR02596 family)